MSGPDTEPAHRTTPWSSVGAVDRWTAPHDAPVPEDPFSCLRDVDLFADLSTAEIDEMDRMAPASLVRRGQLLFSQSEPVRSLCILKSGRVRVFRVAEDGKALTLAVLEAGAVFGEMILVGQRMHDSFAEAIEDSLVCTLGVADVERLLLADARIAARIARLLGDRVAELEDRLTDLALRPLAARVASTLLQLALPAKPVGPFARAVQVRLTHEQIAGVIGATREATSRVLGDFATRGLVRQGRGRIVILDPAALRRAARTAG